MRTPNTRRTRCIARRHKLGLTQTQAGERIGWVQARWSDYESGRRDPTLRTLQKVALALETADLNQVI